MSVFSAKSFRNHEQVLFHCDPASSLRAIISIHDTTLGPALGGCRYLTYDDVLRLSRGMTYKAALANLRFGGGKAVIMAPANGEKSPAQFRAFGRFVDTLGGRYITAEDVGTALGDLEIVHGVTPNVAGVSDGGAGNSDPSSATAWGVFHGLKAAVAARLYRDGLHGVHVAVQRLGHVGSFLALHLAEAGALLTVAKPVLGIVMALCGGPLQPLRSLNIILFRAPAGGQQGAQFVLGIGMAQFGAVTHR